MFPSNNDDPPALSAVVLTAIPCLKKRIILLIIAASPGSLGASFQEYSNFLRVGALNISSMLLFGTTPIPLFKSDSGETFTPAADNIFASSSTSY